MHEQQELYRPTRSTRLEQLRRDRQELTMQNGENPRDPMTAAILSMIDQEIEAHEANEAMADDPEILCFDSSDADTYNSHYCTVFRCGRAWNAFAIECAAGLDQAIESVTDFIDGLRQGWRDAWGKR